MASLSDDNVVRKVQIWLRDMGAYNGPIDGDWGPLSNTAWESAAANFLGTPDKPAEPKPRFAGGLVRIIMHWTASAYSVGGNVNHYHFVIDGDGEVFNGKLKPEDNIKTNDGRYTPHVLNANTGAIGVGMACMRGAVEVPFRWGNYPMREVQVDSMCRLVGKLMNQYGIALDRRTVLTHAEVQPTLGIRQRGKWDITCLPGDTRSRNAITVGDELRQRIKLAA